MELNQVTLVGLIREAKLTETHLIYSLDDMTGPPLDVKQWLNLEHHRSMVAFNIRRLTDFNEITSHMLEVVYAHPHSERSPYSMITSHASDPATIGFTDNQRQVYTCIKNCPLAEGISMQCLRNSLKSLSSYDIRNCLQFLINEGHIFSTIDDYHFKCTNG
ncbi:Replication protein A 32 kDa subunit [Bagarius yarrelli]|uniref:Replication protein A 32 kDa subunit n=1 Tax=Bagarius yarrelli TaxID=175774 RepID=A0A556TNR3_BAGYA|nr:Replication protein A 32 kDa subunit [Bagarius yarrelli]